MRENENLYTTFDLKQIEDWRNTFKNEMCKLTGVPKKYMASNNEIKEEQINNDMLLL